MKRNRSQTKYLNQQYLPLLTVMNAGELLSNSARRSRLARKRLDCHLDVSYGDTERQVLDIFPSTSADSPVHVFIHGGYWRAPHITRKTYSHIAGPLTRAGATTVLLDYELCPEFRISEIVEQIKSAMSWLSKNVHAYNGDRHRIFISGHSAGGHLAAMMMATDWWQEKRLPRNLIKGAVLLSGLFDIEPHRHTDLQQDIRLTAAEAKEMSPMHLTPMGHASVLLAVGENEPDLFHWQSLQYAANLRLHGIKAEYVATPDDNHFSITDRLGYTRDWLTKLLVSQMYATS